MESEPEKPTQNDDSPREKGEGRGNQRRASAATLIDAFAQQYQADREETGRREKHRIFREWLTIIGLFLAAVVAFFQWRELRSTDHNIAEQARVSNQQLVLLQQQLDLINYDQRPWVTGEIGINSDLDIKESKLFGVPVPGMHIGVVAKARNTGKSPALKVSLIADIFIPRFKAEGSFNPKSRCRDEPPDESGKTIFPGERDVEIIGGAGLDPEKVEKPPVTEDGSFEVVLVACLIYKDGRTNKAHHTITAYHIANKVGSGTYKATDKVVKKGNLYLIPYFLGHPTMDEAD